MDFIEYLQEQFDCLIVGDQIRMANGICPFCGRERETAIYTSIPKSNNIYSRCGICFNCGQGYSPVDFVIANEGVSRPEAVKVLSGSGSSFVKTELKCRDLGSDVQFPNTAVDIQKGSQSYCYLQKRGVDVDIIDKFNLKVCYEDDINRNENRYCLVKDRIIFYIYDRQEQLVAWQGRSFANAPKKYMFSKHFKAGEYLYNCWNIQSGTDSLIVVEGVMDAIGWYKNGYKNVVATFGKKISQQQMKIILDINPKTLYIAWDFDTIKDKKKFQDRYSHCFGQVLNIQLDGKDADECKEDELLQSYQDASPIDFNSYITTLLGVI